MSTLASLKVVIGLEDQLSRGLAGISANVQAFGRDMARAGKIATVGLTIPIVAGFAKATKAASDLNEATSATDTIFGKSAKKIEAWAQTTADAYGISNEAALTAVDALSQLYTGVGITTQAAGKFSIKIVEAAGDLASFYNKNPTDVLADLQSGLVGEYEPLRKYGIVLSEAVVQQEAFRETGKTNADQLTDAEKITARQTLIMKGLGAAQGDAARTADGLANTMRRLKAIAIDVAAGFGKLLLPYALKLGHGLLTVVKALGDLSPRMKGIILAVAAAVAAVGPILTVLGYLTVAFGALLSPIGLLIAAFVLIATKTDLLQRAFGAVSGPIQTFVSDIQEAFAHGKKVQDLIKDFPEPLQQLMAGIFVVADAVGRLTRAFGRDGLAGVMRLLPDVIGDALAGLGRLAAGALSFALDAVISIGSWALDKATDVAGAVGGLISDAWDAVKDNAIPLALAVVGILGWALDAATDVASSIATLVVEAWDAVEAAAIPLAQATVGILGWLLDQTTDVASGVATLIVEAWDRVKDAAIPLGTATVSVVIALSDKIDFAGAAKAIGDGVVDAIPSITDLGSRIGGAIGDWIAGIDWTTVVTADTFNLSAAFTGSIHDAIAKAVDIQVQAASALADLLKDANYSALPGKIADGTVKAIEAGAVAFAAVGVAMASAIGGAVAGLVFGPDVSFDDVVTKIQTGVQTAIDASTGWADMLKTQGGNLIVGLGNGAIDEWNNVVSPTFSNLPQAVFDTIGDVAKTLYAKGVDLISGVMTGWTFQSNTLATWAQNFGGWVFGEFADLTGTLVSIGSDLISGVMSGWTSKSNELAGWAQGFGSWIVGQFPDLSGALYDVGSQLVSGIVSGINDAAGSIAQAILDAIPHGSINIFGVTIPYANGGIVGYANGGLIGAAANGQVVKVGERGWEYAALPVGTHVFSHQESVGMLRESQGGSGTDNRSYSFNYTIVGSDKDPKQIADESFALFTRELGLRSAS